MEHTVPQPAPEGASEHSSRIEPLLGEADAAAEWGGSGIGHAVFLHTPSYRDARSRRSLFVIGRRGTGKTAVLRMLQYEIRAGRQSHYLSAWLVDQVEWYRQLAIHLRDSPFVALPDAELEHVAMKMWTWLLSVAAMCGVVWQADRHGDVPDACAADVDVMRHYLVQERIFTAGEKLMVERDPLANLGDALHAVTQAAPGASRLLDALGKRLADLRYEDAAAALARVIATTKRTPLVLVDSVDEYNLSDHVSRAVALGLMRAASEHYNKRQSGSISVKATFPSEVRPFMRVWNPEKVEQASLVINWTHGDLLALVAKRYAFYLGRLDDFGENGAKLAQIKEAQAFLSRHLPATVTSRAGVRFDTLAYVFRHTQRKPRQVIALFNAILSLARARGVSPAARLDESIITEAVHQHTARIAAGVYQAYELVVPEASRLVVGTLAGRDAVFSVADLDRFMKDVSDVRERNALSKEDVRRLIIEAGIVGRVERESELVVSSERKVRVAQVLFQYQKVGSLPLALADKLAIHPMFYEELSTRVPDDLFVYPTALDGEASIVG